MNTTTMERPPLTWITSTVHQISPAPAANRSGKIKTDTGQILSAFADKLQLVEEGGTYTFGCVVTTKAGVNYHDVKAVKTVEAAPQERQPQRATTQRHPVPEGATAAEYPQQQQPKAPAPQSSGGNGFYRPTSPEDKKSMFRCASVTAFIRAGQLRADRNEIAAAIVEIDAGYDIAMEQQPAG